MPRLRILESVCQRAMLQVLPEDQAEALQEEILMASVLNAFYAFLASLFGIVLASIYSPVITPLINAMYTAGSIDYYIAHIGALSLAFVLIIMLPLTLALDDDARVKMKNMLGG